MVAVTAPVPSQDVEIDSLLSIAAFMTTGAAFHRRRLAAVAVVITLGELAGAFADGGQASVARG